MREQRIKDVNRMFKASHNWQEPVTVTPLNPTEHRFERIIKNPQDCMAVIAFEVDFHEVVSSMNAGWGRDRDWSGMDYFMRLLIYAFSGYHPEIVDYAMIYSDYLIIGAWGLISKDYGRWDGRRVASMETMHRITYGYEEQHPEGHPIRHGKYTVLAQAPIARDEDKFIIGFDARFRQIPFAVVEEQVLRDVVKKRLYPVLPLPEIKATDYEEPTDDGSKTVAMVRYQCVMESFNDLPQ